LALERVTTWPPVPAAKLKVTVPVLEVPPGTDAGDKLTALKIGKIVSVACLVTAPTDAVITAVYCD